MLERQAKWLTTAHWQEFKWILHHLQMENSQMHIMSLLFLFSDALNWLNISTCRLPTRFNESSDRWFAAGGQLRMKRCRLRSFFWTSSVLRPHSLNVFLPKWRHSTQPQPQTQTASDEDVHIICSWFSASAAAAPTAEAESRQSTCCRLMWNIGAGAQTATNGFSVLCQTCRTQKNTPSLFWLRRTLFVCFPGWLFCHAAILPWDWQ